MKRKTVVFAVGGLVGLLGAAGGVVLAWPPWPVAVVASRMDDLPPVRIASTTRPLPGSVGIVRVAHASVLLDFDGEVILTDPWFTDTEEYHHGEPLAHAVADLPRLAGVVVSHGHYDHFDIRAFAAYRDKAVPFFVTPGFGELAREAGFTDVHELPPRLGEFRVAPEPRGALTRFRRLRRDLTEVDVRDAAPDSSFQSG